MSIENPNQKNQEESMGDLKNALWETLNSLKKTIQDEVANYKESLKKGLFQGYDGEKAKEEAQKRINTLLEKVEEYNYLKSLNPADYEQLLKDKVIDADVLETLNRYDRQIKSIASDDSKLSKDFLEHLNEKKGEMIGVIEDEIKQRIVSAIDDLLYAQQTYNTNNKKEVVPTARDLEIFEEIRNGDFNNIYNLTTITPEISGFLSKLKKKIELASLESANGLILPEKFNGDIDLGSLVSAEDLILPKEMSGSLTLDSLESADGLVLPEIIGGNLNLRILKSGNGLILPRFIGGNLNLSSITSINGLTLRGEVLGKIYLESLTVGDIMKLAEKYPKYIGTIRHV